MKCYYGAELKLRHKGGRCVLWEGHGLSTLAGGGETWYILSLNITLSNAPIESTDLQMAF